MIDDVLKQEAMKLADRFDDERAAAFGRELPGLLQKFVADWKLKLGEHLATGATSVVFTATDRTGGSAVLKLSPDTEFLARQTAMLRHLEPTGRVPRVLESSSDAGAVLLEKVAPGVECSEVPPTVEQWASLVSDLHQTTTVGVEDTLIERCDDMFDRIGARQRMPEIREHITDEVWGRAVALCRSLLQGEHEQAVIHGDLHLGNALTCGVRGLAAVDPKLCIGDPCFDMVDFVIAEGSPEEMARRVERLASLTGVESERLRSWTGVNAVVTAISRTRWNGFTARSEELLKFAELYLVIDD